MENAIVDLLQLNENSDMTVGSSENKSKYISCIKINGIPILPPLIDDEKRKELNQIKQRAIEKELFLIKQKTKGINQISSETSSIKTLPPSRQSTPTRPATLNLQGRHTGKTYVLSKSRTEGSLNRHSKTFNLDFQNVSSLKSLNKPQKPFKSSLEQRLAAEENVAAENKLNICQQSPILEEQLLDKSIGGDSTSQLGRWSPLKVEQISSLRIELMNKDSHETDDNLQISQDECQTTPETVTQSPNLMRQNSYTLLTPSPALLSFLESQNKEDKLKKSYSGRKTWDLTRARKNWKLNGDGSSEDMEVCSLRKYSSSLDDFSAIESNVEQTNHNEYSVEDSESIESRSGSPESYENNNVPKLVKLKYKGKSKKTRSCKSVPSPKGTEKRVPSNKKENTIMAQPKASDFVPSEIKTELSELTSLLMKMKMDHERQKKELEEKQQSEMKQLEIIFQKREAELLGKVERMPQRKSRKSIFSESLNGSTEMKEPDARMMGDGRHNRSTSEKSNSVEEQYLSHFFRGRRPHSAKDRHRRLCSYEGDDESIRRVKSMDCNEANQDTDFDVSFQDDFMPSKDTTLNNEYVLESDSVSNFSSRSSTISSENRPDLIPSINFKKYHETSAEEYTRYNQAATIITAAAKGFLTRRLLRTAHVQGLITTLKDAITCATQLHSASDIADSDIDLMRRLGRQIEAAWDAVYVVFFGTDVSTRMQLIAADRERLKAIIAKTPVTDPKKKRISSATRKSLDRKRAGSLMSKSQSSATSGGSTRVRMCSKMTASYPGPHITPKLK